jgi:hypothetical protein
MTLLPTSAPARGQAHGSSEAPSFPVRNTTGLVPEPRARNRDSEHLARMCDQEVARPLRERGPARGDRMLGLERAEQRTVFGLRKPDEEASPSGMLRSRKAGTSHDLLISESRDARSTDTPTETWWPRPLPHAAHTANQSSHKLSVSPRTPLRRPRDDDYYLCLRDRIRTTFSERL